MNTTALFAMAMSVAVLVLVPLIGGRIINIQGGTVGACRLLVMLPASLAASVMVPGAVYAIDRHYASSNVLTATMYIISVAFLFVSMWQPANRVILDGYPGITLPWRKVQDAATYDKRARKFYDYTDSKEFQDALNILRKERGL